VFIGHYAVGFAAKRAAPRTSLGLLLGAAIFLDLLWPILLLLGWEQVKIDPGNTPFTPLDFVRYPISHSLVTVIGWSILFGLLYRVLSGYSRGAMVIGLAVASHWFLDAIVHRPDLPLFPGSRTVVGLGLWNSISATVAVEGLMFVAGLWIYMSMTHPRDRIGKYAFWSFVVLIVGIYAANIAGPPPPSTQAVAVVGLAAWLFPLWAAWFDRHRARTESLAGHIRSFPGNPRL
jgi:hypothetical protein